MTVKDLISEYLDREHNNVFCCSANWLMTLPKRGYEREFREAQERVALLEALLERLAGVEETGGDEEV